MKTKERMLTYRFLRPILGTIFKWYYNPKIIGKENIPQTGPIIIVGNHKHLYDQCLAILATNRPIHYMAKKEYFDGRMGWFFKLVGCISVDRGKKDDSATSQALKVLNQDLALGLFPEGTRNKTAQFLLPFKFGAVSMAKKSNALLIPFGLTGDYKFRSKNLTIRFGQPIQIKHDLVSSNRKLEIAVEKLMKENLKW